MKNTFLAGYSRQAFTPDYQVHLTGYGDDEFRLAEGVADDVCVTCVAVTSGEDTILMFSADLLSVNGVAVQWIRERVCPATGIRAEHIYCGATHSHNAPNYYHEYEGSARVREAFLEAAVAAAKEALADRGPAQFQFGVREQPGMNFIRHYIMEDGSYCGSNFGNPNLKFVSHTHPTDPRMLLVRFLRQDKPSITMMNWQAHNDTVRETGYNLVSAGYVAHIRNEYEAITGDHFIFFQGASGNQNKVSRIKEENHGLDWIDYGHKMAQLAKDMLPTLQTAEDTALRTKRELFEVPFNHDWDHMLEQANEVFELWKTVGKAEGDALGKTYGFTSSYQARDIRNRAKLPATTELELNAFCIGPMGFITGPNEIFSTVGIYVRANAPFQNTFIISGNHLYLPCKEAYDYRSYEADTGYYSKGTAEIVQEQFVKMLKDLTTQ